MKKISRKEARDIALNSLQQAERRRQEESEGETWMDNARSTAASPVPQTCHVDVAVEAAQPFRRMTPQPCAFPVEPGVLCGRPSLPGSPHCLFHHMATTPIRITVDPFPQAPRFDPVKVGLLVAINMHKEGGR